MIVKLVGLLGTRIEVCDGKVTDLALVPPVRNFTNTIIGVNVFDWFIKLGLTLFVVFVSILIFYRYFRITNSANDEVARELENVKAELASVRDQFRDVNAMNAARSDAHESVRASLRDALDEKLKHKMGIDKLEGRLAFAEKSLGE